MAEAPLPLIKLISCISVAEYDTAEDQELLTAWRGGDTKAGNALIMRHFDRVYRFFVTKIEDGVEDLVQRTFLGCVEGRDRIQGLSFPAYLLGIARRQLFLHFRHRRRHPTPGSLGETSVHDLHQGSMGTAMAAHEEQRLLLQALRRLPLDMQILVELYYWEELPIREVAAVIDAPDGTIKRRLWEARGQLKQHITELATSDEWRRSTIHGLEDWARSLRDLGRKPTDSG